MRTRYLALVLLAVMAPAQAYIDPGTVSSLYQMAYFLFYGAIGIVAVCYRSIANFFSRLVGRKKALPPADPQLPGPSSSDATPE